MKTLLERLGAFGVTRNWAKAVSERVDWLLENAEWVRELVGGYGSPGVEKPDGSHIVDTEDIVQNYVRALAENKAMKEKVAHMNDVVSIYEISDKELREQLERLRAQVESRQEEAAFLQGDNRTFTYTHPEGYDIWDAERGYGAMGAMYLNERTDNRELRLKVQTLEADREVLLLRLQRGEVYRVWTVRITKARLPTYWYADKIGETFEVFDAGMDGLGLKEDGGKVDAEQRNIQRGDCEQVTT